MPLRAKPKHHKLKEHKEQDRLKEDEANVDETYNNKVQILLCGHWGMVRLPETICLQELQNQFANIGIRTNNKHLK